MSNKKQHENNMHTKQKSMPALLSGKKVPEPENDQKVEEANDRQPGDKFYMKDRQLK